MATPETSNRPPTKLKDQLQVALAAALGIVAGAILWAAIFLRESGPFTWQLVGWMELMLLGGSVTLAWARGLSYQPKQVAKFGALTGAITGAAIDLVFALSLWIFAVIPARPIYEQIADTLLATFRWGSYGFLGGLAIEKEWGRRSAIRVALGLGTAGIVIVFIQALSEQSFMIVPFWLEELGRQFLRAGGWALGLMLFAKSEHILQRPYELRAAIKKGLSSEETVKSESASRFGLKLQCEVALAATIGMTAATLIREAFLNADWSLAKLTGTIPPALLMAWMGRKYFDPYIERLGGTDHTSLDRPVLRFSLHMILALAVVAMVQKLLEHALENNPKEIGVLGLMYAITSGLITLAWARGVRRSPNRAAEFGALTGAISFSVPFALVMVPWAIIIGRQVDQVIVRAIAFALEWGWYGLFGGLAIERRWGDRLSMRMGLSVETTSVALGVAAIGVLLGALLGILTGNVGPPYWKETLTRVLFIAAGWAWGLMLFPKSEDVLKPSKEREDLDCVTPAEQLGAEHNR